MSIEPADLSTSDRAPVIRLTVQVGPDSSLPPVDRLVGALRIRELATGNDVEVSVDASGYVAPSHSRPAFPVVTIALREPNAGKWLRLEMAEEIREVVSFTEDIQRFGGGFSGIRFGIGVAPVLIRMALCSHPRPTGVPDYVRIDFSEPVELMNRVGPLVTLSDPRKARSLGYEARVGRRSWYFFAKDLPGQVSVRVSADHVRSLRGRRLLRADQLERDEVLLARGESNLDGSCSTVVLFSQEATGSTP